MLKKESRSTRSCWRIVRGTGGSAGFMPKKSHRKQRGSSGKSLQMALVEEERAVGAVECRLDTGRGLISPGWGAWRRVSVVRPETPSDSRKQH